MVLIGAPRRPPGFNPHAPRMRPVMYPGFSKPARCVEDTRVHDDDYEVESWGEADVNPLRATFTPECSWCFDRIHRGILTRCGRQRSGDIHFCAKRGCFIEWLDFADQYGVEEPAAHDELLALERKRDCSRSSSPSSSPRAPATSAKGMPGPKKFVRAGSPAASPKRRPRWHWTFGSDGGRPLVKAGRVRPRIRLVNIP